MGSDELRHQRSQRIVEPKPQLQIDERLGTTLRELRQARGWSLSYTGEICGTSGANISKIENGRAREYSLQLLSRLGEAYGMKLYQLFASVDSIDVSNAGRGSAERNLLDAYNSMSEAQRETLLSVAMTLRPPK